MTQHLLCMQHIAVLYFLVIWVWKSMQRPNEQQQRLSGWATNYYVCRLTAIDGKVLMHMQARDIRTMPTLTRDMI